MGSLFGFFSKDANTRLADAMVRLVRLGYTDNNGDKLSQFGKAGVHRKIIQALQAGADPNKDIDVPKRKRKTYHGVHDLVPYNPLSLTISLMDGVVVQYLVDHGADITQKNNGTTVPSFDQWASLCTTHGADGNTKEDDNLRQIFSALASGEKFKTIQKDHPGWADWAMEHLGQRGVNTAGAWMNMLIGAGADIGRMRATMERGGTGECLKKAWAEYCVQQDQDALNDALGNSRTKKLANKSRKM